MVYSAPILCFEVSVILTADKCYNCHPDIEPYGKYTSATISYPVNFWLGQAIFEGQFIIVF